MSGHSGGDVGWIVEVASERSRFALATVIGGAYPYATGRNNNQRSGTH